MKKYPWNEQVINVRIWNVDRNAESVQLQSLKAALLNYNGIKFEDALRNCCIGIAMLMDHVEASDNSVKLLEKDNS